MRFSVVISNYNTAQYIGDAIASVLANRYPDCEIIVVDDGSNDNSREVIESFSEPQVKPIFKKNGGQASAFNAGVAASTGDVICLLDGDDFFFPDKLRTLRQVIEEHDLLKEPFLIRHPLVRIGPADLTQAKLSGYGYSLDGPVPPTHGALTPLTEPLSVRKSASFYGTAPFVGGNASVISRQMCEMVFPVPERLSKFYGDYFPVTASSLVGRTFLFGSTLGAYRYHGNNHSSRRASYVSLEFVNGTDLYLNNILEKLGTPERVSFLSSRSGVRYLAERGRSTEAIRHALGRVKKVPSKRTFADALFTIVLCGALRTGLARKGTRDSGD